MKKRKTNGEFICWSVHWVYSRNKYQVFQYFSLKSSSLERGPLSPIILIPEPSLMIFFSFLRREYSALVRLVKPHLWEVTTFCLPGNLALALLRASMANLTWASLTLTENKMDPMSTRAALPSALPKAPLIPAWSLSAPAHESILLILSTCHGWTLHLKWKASLETNLIMFLLAAIRAASSASEVIYSFSSETMCTT